jgi:hypothetical protein
MIKTDAIAGHKAAIKALKVSIAQREELLSTSKYVSPTYLIPINHLHQYEINRLELLQLELKEMENE